MNYQFEQIICVEVPTAKQIRCWNKKLSIRQSEIIHQLLDNEYIEKQVVPDFNTLATKTVYGIESLLYSMNKVMDGQVKTYAGTIGFSQLHYIVDDDNLVIAIYKYKNVYAVELTTKDALFDKMKTNYLI